VRRRGAWATSCQIRRIRGRFRATDTKRISASSIGPNPNLAIRAGLPRSLFTPTTSPRTLLLAASRRHLVKGWLVASSYHPPSARVSPRVAPPRPVHQRLGERCVSPTSATELRPEHPMNCPIPRRVPRFAATLAGAQQHGSRRPTFSHRLPVRPQVRLRLTANPQLQPCRNPSPPTFGYPMGEGVMPRGPGGASIERSSRTAPPGCGVFNREPSLRRSL
jgi:hypothetical protein